MNDNKELDREAWLTESSFIILEEIIYPTLPDSMPVPEVRVSVGFPTQRGKKGVIASCFVKEASDDNINEIFVTPTISDSVEILGSLAHELIHACDNCESGHRNFFAKTARAIGLEGKFTATFPGDELTSKLLDIIEELGDIPHATLHADRLRKKEDSRQLKIFCDSCGFIARASRKWADIWLEDTTAECPCCAEGSLRKENK